MSKVELSDGGFMRALMPMLIWVYLLSSTASSRASDYSIAYAINARGMQDSGKVEGCSYGKFCKVRSDVTGVSINIIYYGENGRHRASISVSGPDGCCLFA